MKVREILLELAEILNRHGHYGYWIDANRTKIYPVQDFEHEKFIIKNIDSLKIPPGEDKNSFNPYNVAYYNNLVRVSHRNPRDLNIVGNVQDLKKIAKILIASIVQPDVEVAYIERIHPGPTISNLEDLADIEEDREAFDLPADRRKAIQFINGG